MLTRLYLNHNRITFIPETTFHDLESLQVLHLEENQIIFISEGTFNGLRKRCFLLGWGLIPINITNLQSLRQINETLRILVLRAHPHEATSLKVLFNFSVLLNVSPCAWCNIKFLPPKTFKGLSSLVYLDLSYNKINTLQRNIFDSGDFATTGGHPGISFSFLKKCVK